MQGDRFKLERVELYSTCDVKSFYIEVVREEASHGEERLLGVEGGGTISSRSIFASAVKRVTN